MDNKECKNIEEKSEYQKVEGKLYDYYKYKNEIGKLKNTMELLEKQIVDIDEHIRNLPLDTDLPSVEIGERVQTSRCGTSYFEKQLDSEVTQLEKEKIDKIKRIYRIDSKIRSMEDFINEMDYSISLMDDEDKKFIELKYKQGKRATSIALEMNISQATLYRRKNKIISRFYI